MCDTSSMKKEADLRWKEFPHFEYMNLDGSEATPAFPGFVMATRV